MELLTEELKARFLSMEELEAIACPPFGLPIERDTHFAETLFSKLKTNEL
jgi:hypothetical protein